MATLVWPHTYGNAGFRYLEGSGSHEVVTEMPAHWQARKLFDILCEMFCRASVVSCLAVMSWNCYRFMPGAALPEPPAATVLLRSRCSISMTNGLTPSWGARAHCCNN